MVKISGEFPWCVSLRGQPVEEEAVGRRRLRMLQRVSLLPAGLDLSRPALWISAFTSALTGKIQPPFKQKTVLIVSFINILG